MLCAKILEKPAFTKKLSELHKNNRLFCQNLSPKHRKKICLLVGSNFSFQIEKLHLSSFFPIPIMFDSYAVSVTCPLLLKGALTEKVIQIFG